jgi:hypothetical protein
MLAELDAATPADEAAAELEAAITAGVPLADPEGAIAAGVPLAEFEAPPAPALAEIDAEALPPTTSALGVAVKEAEGAGAGLQEGSFHTGHDPLLLKQAIVALPPV